MINSHRIVAIVSGIILFLSFTHVQAFITEDSAKALTWSEMLDSSEYYEQLPDYELAIIWGEKAFESAKKLYGEIDTNVALCAGILSHLYDIKGDIQKVLFYARLDSAIWVQKLGKECQGYVSALSFLAKKYSELSEFPLAEKYYKEMIEINRRLSRGDNESLAQNINSLGLFYKRQGRFKEAEPLYIESLEMARRIYTSDHEDLAMYIDNMAQFYRATGNTDKALELTLEALAMYRRLFPEDNPDLAVSINNAAFFYEDLGKNDEAEKLFTESLEMRKRLFKGDNTGIASQLQNLAGFFVHINKYNKADSLYKEAIGIYKRIGNLNDPNFALCIGGLAGLYDNQDKFPEADSLYKLSYEMTKHIYEGDHPYVVRSLDNLAHFYISQGKFPEAESYMSESNEMKKRLYKGDHQDLAKSIYDYGALFLRKGRYIKAEALLIESLEMLKRLYKGDNISIASNLSFLGGIYRVLGRYKEAEQMFYESFDMTKRIFKEDNLRLAEAFQNLAYLYKSAGRFSEAEQKNIESLEMIKRIFKGDHSTVAITQINLAALYDEFGNYQKAYPLYKEAYEMTKRLYKNDHILLARNMNMYGEFLMQQGRFSESEPLMTESLEMIKRLFKGDHPDLASKIYRLAQLYQKQGKYKDAEELFIKALEMNKRIFPTDNPITSTIIYYLARLYNDQGRFSESEPLLKESLDMKRRLYKGNNSEIASVLSGLSKVYESEGKFEEAEALLKESLEINRNIVKSENYDLAAGLNNLANFYRERGRLEEALPLQKESLGMVRRLYKGDQQYIAYCLNNLAFIYLAAGKLNEAEPTFIESLEMFKRIFNAQSANLSEKEKESYWATMDAKFEFLYSFVMLRQKENPSIIGYAFDNLLYTKALLFNVSNKIKKRIMESGDSVLIAKYKEFTDKKELIIKLYSLTKNEVALQGYNIDSLETLTNNLEKELSYKSEAFKQSYEKKKVSWRSIQTLLKPDEAAIEMVRFRQSILNKFTDTIYYAAMIITDQTTENPEFVLLENGNELEEKYFTQYRNSVRLKSNDNESFKNFWQKIYDKTKEYKKIYFSPDGVYNKLNIGTFLIDSGKYLLDLQKIHQLNSVQELLLGYFSKQDETNVYNSALLIGNPDFSLSQDKVLEKERSFQQERELEERGFVPSRSMSLSPLPGTEKEVDNIAKYLKSKKWVVNMFTKSDAVKASIKAANNPRVLHLATHGLFLSDIKPDEKEIFGMETERIIGNPLLRSGLFFAGASSSIEENFRPTGYDNGFLSAYEAQNLNLDNTELVVLSACETGLGEIRNGEGVYGLQRAFIQAGAKSVIMSLWSVSDDATQELMSTFYREWLGGKTKREAFRIAQMKLKEKYIYPYYWGAFVMVGE